MKFQLLADDDAVLVMKLVTSPTETSSVREAELRLQQNALAKIWDDPTEDLYDDV